MTQDTMRDPAFQPLRLHSAGGATAALCLHGAHLLEWRAAGSDDNEFFLSATSSYAAGAAIRGGLPLIFPQFSGMGPLPKHGFARTRTWTLVEQTTPARLRLALEDDAASRALWPHGFRATLDVTLTDDTLEVCLGVLNTGNGTCAFTAALHGYFAVDDIGQARVQGLAGRRYLDAADGLREDIETRREMPIDGEFDRIYHAVDGALRLVDGHRRLVMMRTGFPDVVVWNPGAARASALADLEPGGWRRMLCVEPAHIARPVELAPGASWTGTQILRRERLA